MGTYEIPRKFMTIRNLGNNVKQILFFLPPQLVGRADQELTKGIAQKIVRGQVAHFTRLIDQNADALQWAYQQNGKPFPRVCSTSAVQLVGFRGEEERENPLLHSSVVGLLFGPPEGIAHINHKKLEREIDLYHEQLVQGAFTTIARKFRNTLLTSEIQIENAYLERIPQGFRILFYISQEQFPGLFSLIKPNPLKPVGVAVRTPEGDHKIEVNGDPKDAKSMLGRFLPTFFTDAKTGKNAPVRSGPVKNPTADELDRIRNRIRDLFEESLNDHLTQHEGDLPMFVPNPRIWSYPQYAESSEFIKDSPMRGIGIGILFLNRGFNQIEWADFGAQTVGFAKERSRARQSRDSRTNSSDPIAA
jgi:hypothetical protein